MQQYRQMQQQIRQLQDHLDGEHGMTDQQMQQQIRQIRDLQQRGRGMEDQLNRRLQQAAGLTNQTGLTNQQAANYNSLNLNGIANHLNRPNNTRQAHKNSIRHMENRATKIQRLQLGNTPSLPAKKARRQNDSSINHQVINALETLMKYKNRKASFLLQAQLSELLAMLQNATTNNARAQILEKIKALLKQIGKLPKSNFGNNSNNNNSPGPSGSRPPRSASRPPQNVPSKVRSRQQTAKKYPELFIRR